MCAHTLLKIWRLSAGLVGWVSGTGIGTSSLHSSPRPHSDSQSSMMSYSTSKSPLSKKSIFAHPTPIVYSTAIVEDSQGDPAHTWCHQSGTCCGSDTCINTAQSTVQAGTRLSGDVRTKAEDSVPADLVPGT